MRVLTTGFGPFLRVTENPSAWLVERCGAPFVVLPVGYDAVDAFLEGLDPSSFDALVMVGVHGRARKIRLECVARNVVGGTPGSDGQARRPGRIDPKGPDRIRTSLWREVVWPGAADHFTLADNAGDYLCNYSFYRAASRFPEKRVGFVHVPPFDRMERETQREALQKLVSEISAQAMPTESR
ncbi:MAG: hypothetical protein KF857_03215 [Fimbriimonadaceae bacterium]|nr:hypothetical protein [Fimbriimonadaceae bacterium]